MQHVFKALVKYEDDVPGVIAYAIYKRSKIEWRTSFAALHDGAEPNAEDEAEFIAFCMLPENLISLRQRGEQIAAEFLAKSLEEKMAQVAESVTQSELSARLFLLDAGVKAGFQHIARKLDEKKSLRAWGPDIVTAFIAGLGVILAVGLLFNGYVRFAAINATAEKAVGIDLDAQQKKTAPLRK
ncbi:hypothetical protein [Duganella violaceipulchra]|uniref:Uncharacterized protein n=1 Tax=Duganella violaceipulchra TaxID=2849652 RepID=A0AA41L600_9BURK|nr:hypothetical protein [Duganella violaceicalia]MBV6322782.1 hypothetical protein [Duganella violaceicalia]MCP2007861.1 hypothetical protein [Duganella violaceicalia]